MALKIKIRHEMNHPYKKYESLSLWSTIKKALADLVENQDVEITTNEEYVIGYLCQMILDSEKGEQDG
jgi:hypothetical protein